MPEIAPWIIGSAGAFASLVLCAGGLLHAVWAFGIWWPARNEDQLVAAVVGVRDAERMPGAVPCLLVAAGLLAAAALPWLPHHGVFGRWSGSVAGVLAAIFAIRAVLVLLPAWRRATAHEPFATLDRRFYAPLSLLLALAFWVLSGQ